MPHPNPTPSLSATVITLNEERNLERCLESLRFVSEVIVVDSGSTDGTRGIAEKFGARWFQNPWKGYGQQKNFAQAQASHDWVLNIDADEVVSSELRVEILKTLSEKASSEVAPLAYKIPRLTRYLGRWIRHGGWYPNALVRLAHRKHARWTEPAVHEAWELTSPGKVGSLSAPFHHYTFRGVSDQIRTNLRYSRLGYEQLQARGTARSWLKLILKPIGKFIETYWIKRGFLDGIPGLIISVNAAHSVFLKFAYFYEDDSETETDSRRAGN